MTTLEEGLRAGLGRHVRSLRTEQGLTLSALATEIGISASALSQIERGKSEPSLGTLWRLGRALRASLFDFFAHENLSEVDVTRADDRVLVEFDRFRYEAITRSPRRKIDLFLLRLEVGDGPVRDVVRHAGQEAGIVVSGRLAVVVAEAEHVLESGDGIWFLSSAPHTFSNPGDEPSVSVWADTVPEAGAQATGWGGSLFEPGRPAPSPTTGGGNGRGVLADSAPAVRRARGSRGDRSKPALGLARALPVQTESLTAVIGELSSIGSRPDGFRVAGTAEDAETATIVAERMRAAGLVDVADEAAGVDGWRLGACSLTVEGRLIEGASLGGTPGTPPAGVAAPLVDVGTGERKRLDSLSIKGRIALLDWRSLAVAPAEVALELGQRGAIGIVLASFRGGPLYQDAHAVGSFDSHWYPDAPPVLTIAKEDAAMLRARLREGELVAELRVEAALELDAGGHNVVGYLPGREPGPPIVVGAHHDGWFSGAFDNASGVASMLALAESLVRYGHQPRHSICFTSRTAEEWGLVHTPFDWCAGAWHQVHATHPDWSRSPFHLCVEASGHPGLRTIVEAPVELAGWARTVCRAASEEGWLTSGWRLGPPVTGTEQWPYLVSGVPGVAAYGWETSFRRTTYHTPGDTPALVDPAHLTRLTRVNALLLLDADSDPDALFDHRARARHIARAATPLGERGEALRAAALGHARRRGRAAFTAIGRQLLAVDVHGETAYPHAQSANDLHALEAALIAVEQDDAAAAIAALERVGTNRLARVQSALVYREHLSRLHPEAPRLSWAAASHLTATPNLWAELAALRGEPGARRPGRWLAASLRGHRKAVERELERRLHHMIRTLTADPSEIP